MGHVYEDHGTISIEGRRESFVVHAGYGYTPGLYQLRDFATLGDEFVAPMREVACEPMRHWSVSLIAEDRIEARESVSSVVQSFDPGQVVERPGFEQRADGPHAEWWREAGHPEFALEDLDDLIAALTDYRAAKVAR